MYNPNRLEWHQDEGANIDTPEFFCGLAKQ